jgi:SAM-dependent methyltransferase
MKDLVKNRRRLSLQDKLRIGRIALKENGPVWCAKFGLYQITSGLADRAFNSMDDQRRQQGIPGINSPTLNKAIWDAWDWSAAGEEWTPSEEWKASVLRCVLERHVPKGSAILEIGPGGGRWTEALIPRAKVYVGVDISESCVKLCSQKFANQKNAHFVVGSGRDLEALDDQTVDVVWSFDVFVHINETEVAAYADEFLRVMRPGAVGIIHHGSAGGTHGGWRSNLTHSAMLQLLGARGFEIVESFLEWQDEGTTHAAGLYKDVITVFRRA